MKIWKSEDSYDKNIYCFYDDLVRLSGNKLAKVDDLNKSNFPSFGLGNLTSHPGKTLCQSDGIVWVHRRFADSREEVNKALALIGFKIVLDAIICV